MNDVFTGVIGHDLQRNYLEKILERKSFAHAYGFFGPASVGKTKIAYMFAASLIGVSVEELVAHPDFFSVDLPMDEKTGERKAVIPVESVRQLRQHLHLSSFAGGIRVTIIHYSDRMNIAAQNALLKTLEEPRKDTVTILLAESGDRLLSTISSRLVQLRFSRLSYDQLLSIFVSKEFDRQIAHDLVLQSYGLPGEAIRLCDKEYRSDRAFKRAEISRLLQGRFGEKMRDFDGRIKKVLKQELLEHLMVLQEILHDAFLREAGCTAWAMDSDFPLTLSLNDLARSLSKLQDAREVIRHNGSVSLSFDRIFLD